MTSFMGRCPSSLQWCLWLLAAAVTAHAQSGQLAALSKIKWNFTAPLRVCTASIEDFGARCNGSPVEEWETDAEPKEGWCADGVDFCGYDVDIWTCAY